jgi:hypothetical protein
MNDLLRELYACQPLPQRALDWLDKQIHDRKALVAALVESDCIVWRDGAFVILCRDQFGDPMDLATWHPRSTQISTDLNRAAMLGEEQILSGRIGPLMVHRSPIGWLRNARRGIVLVDPAKAARRLDGIAIVGEDAAHDRELARRLTIAPLIRRAAA